ncbi:serine hydrolase [Flavobacteriales bacterium]|nr:serine hydrolase [Flavobacteriales bacterium]
MKNINFLYLALFGALNFVGLAIGGLATGPGVSSDWYAGLAKAPWTPPGWVFGAAWTLVMLGFTWFMTAVWDRLAKGHERMSWAGLYAAAWLLNLGWNPLFFGWQMAGLALVEILMLYATIGVLARRSWSLIGSAWWGIVPYLSWLGVAVSLNAYVVLNNPVQPEGEGWPRAAWEEPWRALDDAVEWAVDSGQIPGAVLVITRDGEVAVHKAYGTSNPLTGTPMRKDALFRICSQTKAITATAAVLLWEQGKLDLDDPVSKYLPEFAEIGVLDSLRLDTSFSTVPVHTEMTVRHLMTHTSGISYGEIGSPEFEALYEAQDVMDLFPTDGRSTRDNVRNIASTCLAHQPGSQWNYSCGLDVLVAVIEVASGTPFASFVQSSVLSPLGMKDTHFVLPKDKTDRLTMVAEPTANGGWKRHEHPRYSIDYPLHPEWPLCSGGAGLTSSARDYARFLQCYLDRGATSEGRLMSEATVDSVMADQAQGLLDGWWHQGLAFGVRNKGAAAGSFFWSGYFNTSYFAHPKTQTAVVLMKQTYGLEADSSAAVFAELLWN